MKSTVQESRGALVGWRADKLGDRMVLKIQSVQSPPPHKDEDIHSSLFVIDKNQAVQLGNFLFDIAGQTPPRRKRSWLDRLLGT